MRRIVMLAALAAFLFVGTANAQISYVYPVPVPAGTVDSPATFLSLLNQARAEIGRPALAWDQNLAAFATLNSGYDAYGRYTMHGAGSSGGGNQCASGFSSYYQAFHGWRRSGAHWNILMGPGTHIGVALSPVGMTANVR